MKIIRTKSSKCTLLRGDCLKLLKTLPSQSVDLVLCDLPYGTTACKWDTIIPLDNLWEQYRRVLSPKGVVVLTATPPFSFKLAESNFDAYRYSWIWNKKRAGNFVQAKRMPLRIHEDILVFCFYKGMPFYRPQMRKRAKVATRAGNISAAGALPIKQRKDFIAKPRIYTHAYPNTILKYDKQIGLHPTQKPVGLMRYLIRTYTDEGMSVLDNTMGSGTTGVAAMLEGRNFVGMEKDKTYFKIAYHRMLQQKFSE